MRETTIAPMPATAAMTPNSTTASGGAEPGADEGEAPAAFAAVLQQQLAKPGKAAATAARAPSTEAAAALQVEAKDDAGEADTTAFDPALNELITLFTPSAASAAPIKVSASAPAADAAATAVGPVVLKLPSNLESNAVGLDALESDPAVSDGAASNALASTALPATKAKAVTVDAATAVATEHGAESTQLAGALRPESARAIAAAEAIVKPAAVLSGSAEAIPANALPGDDLPAQPNLFAHAAQPSAGGTATSMRVEAALGTPQWPQDLGQRLTWLAGRNESSAELILTPPSLGRIEVSLSVSGDTTNAYFVSANPTVRDALEQALPRLREVLADAGLNLGQASVNAESAPRDGKREGEPGSRGEAPAGSRAAVSGPSDLRIGRGLVDTFA